MQFQFQSTCQNPFCFLFQLFFIRAYLAEKNRHSDGTADQTQIEEDMIIEANR